MSACLVCAAGDLRELPPRTSIASVACSTVGATIATIRRYGIETVVGDLCPTHRALLDATTRLHDPS